MNKDESSSKNLTTPSLDLASHVLSADLKQSTKPNQNNNNKSCKKNDSTSFLNKSNDCLVQDFDDEEIRSIADRGTNPILKKSNKAKVLFDLNNEGNMDVSSKTSNNPMTSSFCRIGTNFSNRINNTNKQSKWNGKRKNSSSSNLAIPQVRKIHFSCHITSYIITLQFYSNFYFLSIIFVLFYLSLDSLVKLKLKFILFFVVVFFRVLQPLRLRLNLLE